jgi:hypothetical protein
MGRKRGPQAIAVGRRFGENLVELRRRAGLSQIGTAERAGLDRTEINLDAEAGLGRAGRGRRAETMMGRIPPQLTPIDSSGATSCQQAPRWPLPGGVFEPRRAEPSGYSVLERAT